MSWSRLSAPCFFAKIPSLHVSRKLSDVVKVPLLQKNPAAKVREIWLSHDKPRIINGVIAKPEWEAIAANGAACPLFLVPVYPDPSKEMPNTRHMDATTSTAEGAANANASASSQVGYYNLVSEWQKQEVVFTFLEDYQKDRLNAVPFMVLNFFTELLQSHDVVLLRADIVTPKLSKLQGQKAVKFLREAYCRLDRFAHVKAFNERPREFDYKAFEKMLVAAGCGS